MELVTKVELFTRSKGKIVRSWVNDQNVQDILNSHEIDVDFFHTNYATYVFDYFIDVIKKEVKIGECPVMYDFLEYLQGKELRADELFTICSHFKKAMVDFTFDSYFASRTIFDEITYIFNLNLRSLLRLYTDTIYQKEQEAVAASLAKEYFLSNMTHEIKTPLNAIIGFVELMLNDRMTPAHHQKYLQTIFNSGETLLSIINDILDFSKLRSGEFNIQNKKFNIHEEIISILDLFIPNANSKHLSFVSFIDPQLPSEIVADPIRLKQIISNFLSNAIKFTPDGGVVELELKYKNSKIFISVKDSGIGIVKEDQVKIFNAFKQATNSDIGTGLGLSICKQLAEHMGGKINIESTVNLGSTFTLCLPIEESLSCEVDLSILKSFQKLCIALIEPKNRDNVQIESLKRYLELFAIKLDIIKDLDPKYNLIFFIDSEVNFINTNTPLIAIMDSFSNKYENSRNITPLYFPIYSSKLQSTFNEALKIEIPENSAQINKKKNILFDAKVLVVEDNEANYQLLESILNNYSIDSKIVVNGLEAIEICKKESFDLILMDEQMPVLNGKDASKHIKEFSEIPIVSLSANTAEHKDTIYDDYLSKPISIKDVETTLKKYLKERSLGSHAVNFKLLENELQLDKKDLMLLLDIYIKKMKKEISLLLEAIEIVDMNKIAKIAHSIKGSSANFRFEAISQISTKLENEARTQNSEINYKNLARKLRDEFEKVCCYDSI
ncbi:MAG: response regulator [Helicobacteraceae bacterium]|nr:response regulator [Helicobacteraceae bacterium]